MQVLAFVRSEQAYLVLVGEPYFLHGRPSAESGGFDLGLTFKNVGKHVAVITELNITPYSCVHQKLPDTPKYLPQPATPVIPPIAPDAETTALANVETFKPTVPSVQVPSDLASQLSSGHRLLEIYGFVKYETGYWSDSIVGFCFHYLPAQPQGQKQFKVCDNPNYTYSR